MRQDKLRIFLQLVLLLSPCVFALPALKALKAKKYVVRRLTADEVYRLLSETQSTSAIPEGRQITQGLAIISGLATGFRRVIAGGGAGNTARVTTQEVCFETRSARSLAEAEAVIAAYVHSNNEQQRHRVRGSKVGRILKLKRRKKLRQDERRKGGNKRIKNSDKQHVSVLDLGSRTVTTIGSDLVAADSPTSYSSPVTTSMTTDPQTTAAGTSSEVTQTSNPTTTMDNRNALASITTQTTSTSPEGAINCIVIRKTE